MNLPDQPNTAFVVLQLPPPNKCIPTTNNNNNNVVMKCCDMPSSHVAPFFIVVLPAAAVVVVPLLVADVVVVALLPDDDDAPAAVPFVLSARWMVPLLSFTSSSSVIPLSELAPPSFWNCAGCVTAMLPHQSIVVVTFPPSSPAVPFPIGSLAVAAREILSPINPVSLECDGVVIEVVKVIVVGGSYCC